MAGHDVDILLGGPDGNEKEKIISLGGLYGLGNIRDCIDSLEFSIGSYLYKLSRKILYR
ncbi:hypothetical protein [Clostridium cuniculi]|uniref:hypothetical protein n=1 Tax=Clostridium cuniculi TaxID=2548455 RepID=UPI00140F6F19|nr:hypothetical protein [Clostridium cuniculi]